MPTRPAPIIACREQHWQRHHFSMLRDDVDTLFELMLAADRFCSSIASQLQDRSKAEREELRLKLAQCISLVNRLRERYEVDQLVIGEAAARAEVRQLILGLLWVSFYARDFIDRRTFRLLVTIEATFSFLLTRGQFDEGLAS
jgi:hypothetical protein